MAEECCSCWSLRASLPAVGCATETMELKALCQPSVVLFVLGKSLTTRSYWFQRRIGNRGCPLRPLRTRPIYAAPAWWGFASEGDWGRVERFIGQLMRSGYLPKEAPTAAEMVNEAIYYI